MKKVARCIENAIITFGILALVWVAISFAEINSKNSMENPTYSNYNIFALLSEAQQSANNNYEGN